MGAQFWLWWTREDRGERALVAVAAACAVDLDPKDCGISEGAREVPVCRVVCVGVGEFALLIRESLFFPEVNLFSVDNDDR